jgi:hypothetical protein
MEKSGIEPTLVAPSLELLGVVVQIEHPNRKFQRSLGCSLALGLQRRLTTQALDAKLLGQPLHCRQELQPFHLLDEIDGIAMGSTSEAVVMRGGISVSWKKVERRTSVLVKRTQRPSLRAAPLSLDAETLGDILQGNLR